MVSKRSISYVMMTALVVLCISGAFGAQKKPNGKINKPRVVTVPAPKNAAAAEHMNKALGFMKENKLDQAAAECKLALKIDPKLVAAHMNLASIYVQTKDIDAAASEFQQVINLDPNNPKVVPAYVNLAAIRLQRKEIDGALPLLVKVSSLDPSNAAVANELARIYMAKNRLKDAETQASRAAKLNPQDPSAFFTLGIINIKQSDFPDATKNFRRNLELDPDSNACKQNLAYCYMQTKEYSKALGVYDKLIADQPNNEDFYRCAANAALYAGKAADIVKNLEFVHKAKPDELAVTAGLADGYDQLGKTDKARELYLQVLEKDKKNLAANFALGRHAFMKNDFKSAQSYFSVACATDPKNVGAKCNLAIAESQLKDYASAEKHFKAALAVDPKSLTAMSGLAGVYNDQQKYKEAIQQYRAMYAISPSDRITRQIIDAYEAQKDYAGAEKECLAQLNKNPKNQIMMSMLVSIYTDAEKYDKAVEQLQKMYAAATDVAGRQMIANQIIEVQTKAGKLDDAAQEFAALASKDPRDIKALEGLCQVYQAQKRYPEAIDTWRKIDQIDPKSIDANLNIASIYLQQQTPDKFDKALAEYNAALKKSPNSAVIMNNIVGLYRQKGDMDKAVEELRLIAKTCPDSTSPGQPTPTDRIADIYVQQNKPEAAIAEYKNLLAKDPKDSNAYRGIARIYSRNRDFASAAENWKAVVNLNPSDTEARTQLITCYNSSRKYDLSEKEYGYFLKDNPKDTKSLTGLGYVQEMQKKFPEALATYKQAEQLEPAKAMYHSKMAGVLVQLGKKAEAVAEYEKGCKEEPKNAQPYTDLARYYENEKDFDQAIATYHRILAFDDKNVGAMTSCVDLLMRQSKFDEAIAQQRKLTVIDPKASGPCPEARMLVQAGRVDEAIAEYRKNAETDTENRARIIGTIGDLLEKNNRLDEALVEYQKVADDQGVGSFAKYKIAEVYAKQGKKDEAIAKYKEALTANPNSPETIEALGELYTEANKQTELLDFLKQFIAAHSSDGPCSRVMEQFKKAGKSAEGLAFFETLVKPGAPNMPLTVCIAMTAKELGQYQKAIDYTKTLLGNDERKNAQTRDQLGDMYDGLQNYDEAVKQYQMCLAQFDRSPIRLKLAKVLEKLGRKDEALENYRKIQKTTPTNPEVEAAIARLTGAAVPAPAEPNKTSDQQKTTK